MRVLVVDDEPEIVVLLEKCLTSWGYEVLTASGGSAALELVGTQSGPVGMLLDWDMPDVSGLDVCRKLKQQCSESYVAIITGKQTKRELIEALEAGADDVLPKPFHLRELQLRLARGIERHFGPSGPSHDSSGELLVKGSVLSGSYRLERPLADGGSSSVWRAVHLSLGIDVAIKLAKPHRVGADDSFEREARIAALLQTEHIVRVYDHGVTAHGTPFLVMEYVNGESLAERIDRSGPLGPEETAEYIYQVAKALSEAHGAGFVHGDVKPDNILVSTGDLRDRPSAKLADFGLARSRWFSAPRRQPHLVGTPHYLSPECIGAQAPLSPESDIWALAVTAVTALTGRVPFDGDTLEELRRSIADAPPPVPSCLHPQLTPAIDAWFAKACACSQEQRFKTPEELARALHVACHASTRAHEASGPLQRVRPSEMPTLSPPEPTRSNDDCGHSRVAALGSHPRSVRSTLDRSVRGLR